MSDKVVGQVSSDKPGANDKNPPSISFADVISGKAPLNKPQENTTDSQGTSQSESVKNAMRLYRSTETKAPVTQPEAKPSALKTNSSEMVKNGSNHSIDNKLGKNADTSFELGNQKYIYDKKSWVNEVTTQVMGPMMGAFAYRVPRATGFHSMLLGTASGTRDVQHFLNATTGLEQLKYGSASIADASLVSGGTLMMLQKAPKLGPTLVIAGVTGRLIADVVPNRIESLFER